MTFLARKHLENVQDYVGSHLLGIMEEQEKRLGIKHLGIPKILYDVPEWLTSREARSMGGAYNDEYNEIYLNHKNLVIPKGSLTNIVPKTNIGHSHWNIEDVLHHELGHLYANNTNKSLTGYILSQKYGKSIEDNAIIKLFYEGIAEYFRLTLKGSRLSKPFEWPINAEALLVHATDTEKMYVYGFHLVKPILDAGVKKGILHFLQNMPNMEDLNNVLRYQANVIEYLSMTP